MVAKLSTIKRKIKNGEKLGFSERARAVNKGLLPRKQKKEKMLIDNSKKIVIKLGSTTVIDKKGNFKKAG